MATDTNTADLEAEIEVLKGELEAVKSERDRINPIADISGYVWNSPDDVTNWFTEDQLLERANRKRALETRNRFRRGLPPLPEPPESQHKAIIEAQKSELFNRRKRPPQAAASRVVKLLHPTGKISEIPYEPQINNIAGSLADGLIRYQRKGFKQVDPFLCCRKGCWEPAAKNSVNEFDFGGYCSQLHLDEVEGRNAGNNKLMAEVALGR